jgi:hypothetical protein
MLGSAFVTAEPLAPRITPRFAYAQARHFHIDRTRVRHACDKGSVERAVPSVCDGCFAGEASARISVSGWTMRRLVAEGCNLPSARARGRELRRVLIDAKHVDALVEQ